MEQSRRAAVWLWTFWLLEDKVGHTGWHGIAANVWIHPSIHHTCTHSSSIHPSIHPSSINPPSIHQSTINSSSVHPSSIIPSIHHPSIIYQSINSQSIYHPSIHPSIHPSSQYLSLLILPCLLICPPHYARCSLSSLYHNWSSDIWFIRLQKNLGENFVNDIHPLLITTPGCKCKTFKEKKGFFCFVLFFQRVKPIHVAVSLKLHHHCPSAERPAV